MPSREPRTAPSTPSVTRRHVATSGLTGQIVRKSEPSCLSAAIYCCSERSFKVLWADRQLCTHGARTRARVDTLTRARSCCFYVLFWENLFSRCKTAENIDWNIRYHFFSDLESDTNYIFLKQGQRKATLVAQSRGSRCRAAIARQD